jgi:hypothetical protein
MASPEIPPQPATDQPPPAPKNGNGHAKELAVIGDGAKHPVSNFNPDDPVSMYMDTGIFGQLQRVGLMMCASQLVPGHLRGPNRAADCALVAAQAFRWRMDPLAVAAHTFVVSGKLGYEGKFIAALINTSGKIEGRLKYEFSGTKGTPERSVRAVARLKGEDFDRDVDGTVADWRTTGDGSPWSKKSDYDRQLRYRGAREWVRAHAPELLLGVQDEDDLAAISERDRPVRDVTPPAAQVVDVQAESTVDDPLLAGAPTTAPQPSDPLPPSRRPAEPAAQAAPAPVVELPKKPEPQPCEHNYARKHSKDNVDKSVVCPCGVEFFAGNEVPPLAGPEE